MLLQCLQQRASYITVVTINNQIYYNDKNKRQLYYNDKNKQELYYNDKNKRQLYYNAHN
jgi:hypothetical protein